MKIYQVVCSVNYREIGELIDYGKLVDADEVELSVFDPIPGRTSMFHLNDAQIRTVTRFFETFEQPDRPFVHHELFLRRLQNIDIAKGAFDNGIVASIPCAAGWFYARITTMGLVNGCLKAHRIPTGNLHKESFSNVWNGEAQNVFRRETKTIRADNPYLMNIGHDVRFGLPGCFRICDNLGQNQGIMRMAGGLSESDRAFVDRLVAMARSGATRDELIRFSETQAPPLRPMAPSSFTRVHV
ncbi:MAG: SPASM domain-containing protein [Deltaproteobacteria bacterium]|nr:SPASM domain-containing protein [Deltaproteobacteria bacterium]